MSIVLLILWLLLFGAPFIASVQWNNVSVIFLRDLFLIALCLTYLLSTRPRKAIESSGAWLPALGLFSGYVLLSSLLSIFGANAGAISIRLIALVLIAHVMRRSSVHRSRQADVLLKLLVAYYVISLLIYPFDTEYLEGLLGRHYTKFVALSGFSIAFSMYVCGQGGKLARACFVLSLAVGSLCMQRGFFIAAFVVLLATLSVAKTSPIFKLKAIGIALVLAVIGWWLLGDRVMDYAFYENIGPHQIIDSLLDGSFDIEMLRTRARLDLIGIMTDESTVSFLGHGAGWSKSLIAQYYDGGKEPHNDILMLLYDYGIAGLLLFFGFVIAVVRRGVFVARRRCAGGRTNPHSVAAASLMLGCLSWMFFSNVLIYSMAGLIFVVVFLSLADAQVPTQSLARAKEHAFSGAQNEPRVVPNIAAPQSSGFP